jgi:hypothetical protein
MHDEGMNTGKTANTEEALLAELDAQIVRALEVQPEAAVPANFAARVMERVPARRRALRRPVAMRTTHYGWWAIMISLVVLPVALLAGEWYGGHTAMGAVVECLLYLQLVGLAVWMGVRQPGLR